MTDKIEDKRADVIDFIRASDDPELIQEVWQVIDDYKTIKEDK